LERKIIKAKRVFRTLTSSEQKKGRKEQFDIVEVKRKRKRRKKKRKFSKEDEAKTFVVN